MKNDFRTGIARSNASRASREYHLKRVLSEPDRVSELMAFALSVTDKNHHKACWILELVAGADLLLLRPFLDDFCRGLPLWNHPGAERAGARITLLLADAHLAASEKGNIWLTSSQFGFLVENAFDRMASPDSFVAAKSLLMRALFKLGRCDAWIHPELKDMLERDFAAHSVAYRAAAREVLGWLAKS